MADLTYTVSDFVAFTKIKSSEVNSKFQSIKDHFNLTNQITRASMANGTADHVLINSGTGAMSSEAALNVTRGGTGVNIDSVGLVLKELATPATPSSGYGKVYFKSDGFLYQLNDDGTETKVGAGSGGGTNYVLNPDFESSVSNWSVYNDTFTFTNADVDTGTETITATAHGLLNDDKVVFTSSGTLPAGLTAGTTYYVVGKTANTFQVSATLGGAAVNLTDGGSGTHTTRPLQPINATAGSGNITFTRSTSNPLASIASALITKDAATRAGEGVSTDLGLSASDLNINREDLAKILQVEFSYEIVSGTFAPGSDSALGDATVHIYDVTNTRRIELAPFKITGAVIGSRYKYTGVFQSDYTSRQYRLAVHISSASGTAYVVKLDSVRVGPQIKEVGTPITEWSAYTPTFTGFGTPTSVEFFYRRVGGNLEIIGKYTAGVNTTTEARISLPAGLVSTDTTLLPSIRAAGNVVYGAAAAAAFYALIEPSVAYLTIGFQGAGSAGLTKINADALANSTAIAVQAVLPIQGWSSQLQMSSDADTRVVAAHTYFAGNTAVTANATIAFDTIEFDTHGAMSAGVYTVPVPGIYNISGLMNLTTSAANVALYKNGSSIKLLAYSVANNQVAYNTKVKVIAGDLLTVRIDGSLTVTGGATQARFEIARISGPEQIAASETIAARYTSNAGQSIDNAATEIVDFEDKDYDTHSAVTTGASWKFTAPANGRYKVISSIIYASAVFTTGAEVQLFLYKNGVVASTLRLEQIYVGITDKIGLGGEDTLSLVSGDYIDIRSSHGESAGRTLATGAGEVRISIERVGL